MCNVQNAAETIVRKGRAHSSIRHEYNIIKGKILKRTKKNTKPAAKMPPHAQKHPSAHVTPTRWNNTGYVVN